MSTIMTALGYIVLYYSFCLAGYFLLRRTVKLPDEVYRKYLHFMQLGTFVVWLYVFPSWQSAALCAALFIVAVYPILTLFGRIKGFTEATSERRAGELRSSLVQSYSALVILILVLWGALTISG